MLVFENSSRRANQDKIDAPAHNFQGFGPARISVPRRRMRGFAIPDDLVTARAVVRAQCKPVAGVYGWVTATDELIYVGYSANLPNRLLTYFSETDLGRKETRIAARSARLVWEEVGHPLAAQLRELELIRRFHPLMNRQGKSTRGRVGYLCAPGEGVPRFRVCDRETADRLPSWGPLHNNRRLSDAVHQLNVCFGLADSSRDMPMAVDNVKTVGDAAAAVEFLEGRGPDVLSELLTRMEEHKEQQHFHAAARVRDCWSLLGKLRDEICRLNDPQRYEFVYAPKIGAKKYWFLIRDSLVQWVGCEPSTKQAAEAVARELTTEHEPMFNVVSDRAQRQLVNRWFQQEPGELELTLSLGEALGICEGG